MPSEKKLSVPIRLLQEAEGHLVQIETTDGTVVRGYLAQAEDTMNVKVLKATVTDRNGQSTPTAEVFLRGSRIRFYILPEVFARAPLLNPSLLPPEGKRGGGSGFNPAAGCRPGDVRLKT
eukprot:TRINITY_DN33214_c0_g1_i1.p1 TRINITY_DN33214_c0_g1~~TRINITY_DN33214_c0_g1_i1.p1  ORF type:complete len:120 (-),score=8.46 TRINITY_DN33214_c0_g1_i1:384-743(-)